LADATFYTPSNTSYVQITSVTLNGTTAIITGPNSFTAGVSGNFANIVGGAATGLNTGTFTVISTGLSSTQFEVAFTGAAGGPYAQPGWTEKTAALVPDHARSWVIHVGATYYLYTIPMPAQNQIDVYTSSDGVTFTLANAGALTLGTTGAWDSWAFGNNSVVFDGSTYRMLYDAYALGASWQMGAATSSDGIHWAKYANNPVIGQIGNYYAGAASVWRDATTGMYWCWANLTYYQNGGVGNALPTDIARWSSPDFVNWTQSPIAPTFPRLTWLEGARDYGGQVTDVDVMQDASGNSRLYYTASSSQGKPGAISQVNVAVAPVTLHQLVGTDEGATLAYSSLVRSMDESTNTVQAFVYGNFDPTVTVPNPPQTRAISLIDGQFQDYLWLGGTSNWANPTLNNLSIGGTPNTPPYLTMTGSLNTAVNGSLQNCTASTCVANTGVGPSSLAAVNLSYNSGFGKYAGTFLNDGSTLNTGSIGGFYFGANTEAYAINQTNESVIGTGAHGHGSHTFTFGDSSTSANYFTGAFYSGANNIIPSGATAYLGSGTGGAVFTTNTLGCLDGYDHTPCVIKKISVTALNSNNAGTIIASTGTGFYRLTASVCVTTAGSAGTVQLYASMNGGVFGAPNGTPLALTTAYNCLTETISGRQFAAQSIQAPTIVSGNVGGVYTLDATVEYVAP
jgi:hypothetical protein